MNKKLGKKVKIFFDGIELNPCNDFDFDYLPFYKKIIFYLRSTILKKKIFCKINVLYNYISGVDLKRIEVIK